MLRRVVMVAIVTVPALSVAQPVAEHSLPASSARLSTGFGSVNSIRELADGRLLVADQRSGQLFVADFQNDRVVSLGRSGRGPGEYEAPGTLFPLASDSTLMIVPGSRSAMLLVGTGFVTVLPPSMPLFQNTWAIGGADGFGRVLVERRRELNLPAAGVITEGARDSAFLVLVSRQTGKSDTIGQVRVAERRFEVSEGRSGGTAVAVPKPSPIAIKEAASLASDGWLAVVRRDPYRVDWRRPDGSWIIGETLTFTRQRVDDAEKAFIMEQWVAEGMGRSRSPDRFKDWPASYPPFATSSVGPTLLTQDGMIAIRKSRTSRLPDSRYDVVDRRARVVRRVVLPANQFLAGFGRAVVYVGTTDEDGLTWLTRHAWR